MCGIFGAVAREGAALRHPASIAAMAAALRHRGPDGECIVGHERVRIGARRLAIMDLTTGDQPFQSPDGKIWMVCNGEIYNAPALRREASGGAWRYPFRSQGDIETIVPFYERFGPDAIARLEGMFGLAIWDEERSRLMLARDRAGEKPLFWTEASGELRFASEIQALLEFPDQPRRVNRKARSLYRALGYVPAPYTMFEGIHKLPPASLLIAEKGRTQIRSYWSAADAASRPSTLSLENTAELRDTLLRAVKRELMSDVPLGIFTSGGLDSSLLVAAAARGMPGEKIHTYAVRFTEPGYDESEYAEAVTHEIASVHHVVTADDESLGRALEVVSRSLAEPLGDPAVLPTWLLAEAARENVKVILSGEGADELFGGYPTYLGHQFAERWQRVPGPLRHVVRWAADRWPSSTGKMTLEYMLKQFLAAAERPWLERHLTWLGAVAIDEGVIAELACKLDRFPHDDPLNRVMWLDFLTYLPDDLLVKVDRATMLASVEARAPFLDREVMELVLPGPSRFKVRGLTTKAILKEAARGLVPDAVIHRQKRGLSVPVARWLNTGLAPLADRLLDTPLLAEHRTGRRNHARRLWPQLMLALWAERWGVELS
ncbi:MAG TPA: asparagine synthase (glutamine-hydrolyzing) [Gemmatimonadales bacterium]|jgi:asparagine synthase (glutamine-hydrolysing)|nr:asparagine synthase (glutamine-hydrolyzing) [Gemmatimonadales bacterium]